MQICPGESLNVPIHDITEAEAVTRSIPVKIIENNEQKNIHSELNIMQKMIYPYHGVSTVTRA